MLFEIVCPATERLSLAELKLTFGELETLDFTGFLECGVANTLQTQNFSLLLTAP
ncbi:MAG: hypothetical protein UGF43_07070 [Blautia sp.]|uniref:hypothetical protein n=1 Tax=Blautia sp. TaxID=1955243 RepID=UPI002E79E03D|nr:hypothetical protein [Blautia sp.]MEE1443365.1 hypothetical protein [Blautia sp.]